MAMRITTSMVQRNILADLNSISSKLTKSQMKAASNKEITRPSDDPFATAQAMALRLSLSANQQHQRNVEDAMGWMDATEQALMDITDSVEKVKSLLVQATSTGNAQNMGLDATARTLLDQVGSLLNVKLDGRYLFAGSATDTAPVDLTALAAPPSTYPSTADTSYYNGDGVTLSTKAGPNLDIDYGVKADEPGFVDAVAVDAGHEDDRACKAGRRPIEPARHRAIPRRHRDIDRWRRRLVAPGGKRAGRARQVRGARDERGRIHIRRGPEARSCQQQNGHGQQGQSSDAHSERCYFTAPSDSARARTAQGERFTVS